MMKTGGGAARSAPPDAAEIRQRIEELDALPVADLKALWIEDAQKPLFGPDPLPLQRKSLAPGPADGNGPEKA